MKILKVKVSNYKNCVDDYELDFIPKSKKTLEDKEYELQEVSEKLFTFNTMGIVGKNASGKTTAVELLSCCYSILEQFSLDSPNYTFKDVNLEIIFFHDNFIYKYNTTLDNSDSLTSKVSFSNQTLLYKPYFKSYFNEIFEDESFEPYTEISALPEDTSIVFFPLKKKTISGIYFSCNEMGNETYDFVFKYLSTFKLDEKYLNNILAIFDTNVKSLKQLDDNNYKLVYLDREETLSNKELFFKLSSGTTKGLVLYLSVIISLKYGIDLVVDEIENHFHKTLVENILNLYKDKTVNKKNATLIFTTHYCEILDSFNRQDNIWISKSKDKVYLENMYLKHTTRTELLKSKLFYNNAFDTAVNYEALMNLKKELML